MMKTRSILLLFTFALFGLLQTVHVQSSAGKKPVLTAEPYFFGNVVPVSSLPSARKLGITASADARAMVADNGVDYVLLNDDGSRLFFKDARLLNRPMRLTAHIQLDTGSLQVSAVHSVKNGTLHDVYYWCEVCKLRFSEPGICHCCGGPTELIEEPVR